MTQINVPEREVFLDGEFRVKESSETKLGRLIVLFLYLMTFALRRVWLVLTP